MYEHSAYLSGDLSDNSNGILFPVLLDVPLYDDGGGADLVAGDGIYGK